MTEKIRKTTKKARQTIFPPIDTERLIRYFVGSFAENWILRIRTEHRIELMRKEKP